MANAEKMAALFTMLFVVCCNLIIAKKAAFAQYFLDGEECGRMCEQCLVVGKHN